jgi:DNA-binding CsgD family transcriptional regulator
MTEKDDPSRVAFGRSGAEPPRPTPKGSSGNGADGNGTSTGGSPAFSGSAQAPAGFSSLGRLVLNSLHRGVIAIDATRAIIDANRAARRVLETGESIRLRNGRLEFANPCLDAQLTALLAELSSTSTVAQGFVAHLHRQNGARPFRVLVTPVPNGATESAAAVLVNIFDTHCERAISHQVLRDLYGLTNAQADITARLFEGHTVDQTGHLLGLSVNTVRSHLKRIFEKCAVHSQSELLYLLSVGPLSI